MSSQRQLMIKEKIKDCVHDKFKTYSPKTTNKPFHYRCLAKIEWLCIPLFTL